MAAYGGMSKEEFNKRECARDCKYNKKHDEKCHCEEKKRNKAIK